MPWISEKTLRVMFGDLAEYYLRWYHDRPVGITPERTEELRRLHRCLYAMSEYFVMHYDELVPKYMPLSDKEMEILEIQAQYPFHAGTWRPDYIIDREGNIKICEITSRFFGHGIFLTWFAEKAADRFMARFPGVARTDLYPVLLEYLLFSLGARKEIFVFKSADRTSAIRLYKRFYELHGCKVTVLESYEVEQERKSWDRPGVQLLSALNQKDILSYGTDTLKAMADRGMVSDFRTVFLIHDKRFMSLWLNKDFTSLCLSGDDASFVASHSIATFPTDSPASDAFLDDAYRHKDGYILKPARLGKSEGLYAGPLVDEALWRSLWKDRPGGRKAPEGMVLQPFVVQKTFPVIWEGTAYKDYLCGMMLCVDDRYFDSGMFRASSLPVTNIGDDRKACAVAVSDPEVLKYCDIL